MSEVHIEISDKAREKFLEFLESEDDGLAIRLEVDGRGPHGFNYLLDFVTEADEAENHVVLDFGDFRMLVDPGSTESLEGVTIDFVQRGLESGFHFENPNSQWKDPVAKAVQEVLDTQINPSVAGHGGFVSLLDVKESTAYIALGGGCQGCGMADVTLKQGIEVAIKSTVPEIEAVLDTTDHASGENPYYQPSKGGDSPFG